LKRGSKINKFSMASSLTRKLISPNFTDLLFLKMITFDTGTLGYSKLPLHDCTLVGTLVARCVLLPAKPLLSFSRRKIDSRNDLLLGRHTGGIRE
jgi:hypothetical protein